jgi:hypothetical protein
MKKKTCVYVVGAGFSAGLGYPLTHDLLLRLWTRFDEGSRRDLTKVIGFHHPGFNPERFTSYPNIEVLLSEMAVNEELFEASRQYSGRFTLEKLRDIQRDILLDIAAWFHELSEKVERNARHQEWLTQFREIVFDADAAIISFNWDLILDKLLFGEGLRAESYGLSSTMGEGPILLKPHGSLNWYDEKLAEHITDEKKVHLDETGGDTVYAFTEFRSPRSKVGRMYFPLIVPPVYLKRFDRPLFKALWQRCTSTLSTAQKVVFLGYSMPLADLHAQFILRCGFHNQVEGELEVGGKRKRASGPAEVIIVNPDRGAADRIAGMAGPGAKCSWVSEPAAEWVRTRQAGLTG